MLLMAAFALLTLGTVSCERDDDNTNQDTPSTPSTPTNPSNPTDPANPTSGQWVDLGLPSGLLWYSVNLGATSPEQYGDYYAWGETRPKSDYSWSTYAWGSDYDQITKYCCNAEYGLNGFTDNLTTLQSTDDAATAVLGGGARMPTKEEWRELLDNTTAVWTTYNGVNGRRFTGTNGNSIFLRAGGYRNGSGLGDADEGGYYWSSSLYTDGPCYARGCFVYSGNQGVGSYYRDYGLSVRAVRASQN